MHRGSTGKWQEAIIAAMVADGRDENNSVDCELGGGGTLLRDSGRNARADYRGRLLTARP